MTPSIITYIQFRLMITFIASILAVFLCSFWGLNYYLNNERTTFIQRMDKQLENNFNQAIRDDVSLLKSSLLFIGNNEKLQNLWQLRDKDKLLVESDILFQQLKKNHHISHFYYHDLTATNFLRVHEPNKSGGKINRKSLQKAINTNEIYYSLEFGTLGQFVLRVIMPWHIDGDLVGYIELGEEINHIISRLSINNNYQLILTISKQFIYNHQLEQSDFFKSKSLELSQYKNIYIVDKTMGELTPALRNIIDNSHSDRNNLDDNYFNNNVFNNNVFNNNGFDSVNYQEQGKEYQISRFNQLEQLDENSFSLYFLIDVTATKLNQIQLRQLISVVVFLFALLLFIFYYFYSKKIKALLLKSYEQLNTDLQRESEAHYLLSENKVNLERLIKQQTINLEATNQRYQTLFDKTADALLIIEGKEFVDCNQATLDMLGFQTKDELYNIHPSKLSPKFQPDGMRSDIKANMMMETALKEGNHRFEWYHLRKNGEVFPVEVLLTAIPFDDNQLLHVVWRDITERKETAAEIERQAYYDSLTGLPNRKLLLDRMEQSLISCRRHQYFSALLFMDLDRFKSINDSLGHSFGDKLLIESAKKLSDSVWDEDTVSRFGGDEYVILLNHLGKDKESASLKAKNVASRIQEAFSLPFVIENQEIHISTSIGIAIFPSQEESIEDIIKHADTAMYSAKDNGRNQIAFYLSSMHDKVIKRLTLEKNLRIAIKEKQLEVYYQPQLNNQGLAVSVEALVRWQHIEHGFINPEEFVAIAEDTGLIYELGDFVLNRAIKEILDINKSLGITLQLSVNISPRQFKEDVFIGKIKSIVENFQLEKNFLTLEVTEGIAIENLAETISKFNDLKHIGTKLSLDDFGTGYSSLSHLKRLPINELKIDKSFVFDVLDDPQDALLVKTIINIAHQFGLTVVAEGVETVEQLNFLKAESCDIYQGYYYSRPLPLAKLTEFIKSNLVNSDSV